MCRLFALHAGPHDVPAEFWLLSAPDSFAAQSERNAEGFGIAALSTRDGLLLVRNPVKAGDDAMYRQVPSACGPASCWPTCATRAPAWSRCPTRIPS